MMQKSPFKRPAPLVLLSQGAARPGMVQGQHWGHLRTADRPYGLVFYPTDWSALPITRPTPRSHADPRLSSPEVR